MAEAAHGRMGGEAVEVGWRPVGDVALSYCVVNTSQRELLLRGLDAIAAERRRLPFDAEVLVLDLSLIHISEPTRRS